MCMELNKFPFFFELIGLKQIFNLFGLKEIFLFSSLSFLFSIIGIFLPFHSPSDNPLASATIVHVVGHIVWGMMAAFVTLSFRYILLSGIFALFLDADHLVSFLGVDVVIRMGHSIPFAIIIGFFMIYFFKKRDYLLGVISFGAVFSHMSFDTLRGSGTFPIFIPFSNYVTNFNDIDWIFLQLIPIFGILIIKFIIKYFFKKTS